MAIIIDHAPINVSSGSQEFGPANISNPVSTIILRLARSTTLTPTFWPNGATTVKAQLLISLDGGTTYQESCGLGGEGGIYIKRDGTEATESTVRCALPAGTGRKGKALITVTNGPLVSQLTVEVI